MWLEASALRTSRGRRAAAKRCFDITVSALLLGMLFVPLVLIALAIKLDSAGPVLYRVRRVGHRGRPLHMLKFRKMRHDAGGLPLTASADPRFTRVGALLARTRLDELPQLWDVLRGRMSIVGPRPEDPAFVSLHCQGYDRILAVRPGITGLSQLAFAEEDSILDQNDLISDYVDRVLPQKVGLDVLYAGAHRLGMDLSILAWTVAAVVLGRQVAVHRRTGALSLRRPRRALPPAVAPPAHRRGPAASRIRMPLRARSPHADAHPATAASPRRPPGTPSRRRRPQPADTAH